MTTFTIHYNQQEYNCCQNETLLEAFLRQGVSHMFSCRKGSCQVCMMCCDSGEIPPASQKNIRAEYVEKKYFLPCSCYPMTNMRVRAIPSAELYNSAVVHKKEKLSDTVFRLLIEPTATFDYKPGQYVNLRRITDGLARSYSLLSHPDDYFMEFHIKKMPDGKFSSWLFDDINEGDEIEFQGPIGDCHYGQITDSNSSILLAATGTGLAPVLGIANDALRNNHMGDIYLYHGGRSSQDIYLHHALLRLADRHKNVYYRACVNTGKLDHAVSRNILDVIKQDINEYGGNYIKPAIFLAGSTAFVESLSVLLKQYGISDEVLFSDAFDLQDLRSQPDISKSQPARRVTDIAAPATENIEPSQPHDGPDSEMWHALDQGKKLKIILDDFYAQVYQDEKLSGFFENSTQRRSSEKQYLFMRQLFTGEKVFFGDRPKNAHHWMVISNELFDYRENLMANCLRTHGLAEHLIQRWVALDETFRKNIVKDVPQAKIINGIEMPLDGFDELKIDVGSICDGCQQAIEVGETVRYHIRLGLTYCGQCMQSTPHKQGL